MKATNPVALILIWQPTIQCQKKIDEADYTTRIVTHAYENSQPVITKAPKRIAVP
jgi:hypothetical protein